jgi:hypothetical protein
LRLACVVSQEGVVERAAIGEHAERRKQLGPTLDLVVDDDPAKRGLRRHWLVEPREALGAFQVEVLR